jgi:glucose/arabinose dehydrogenase
MSQNLASAFGKIFRIDPMGRSSANGKYGIPASNPFVNHATALKEIYAYGVRNPQRFAWDPANGTMILAEIGQNVVEEIGPVTAGGNLGWNIWEGSFGYTRQGVDTSRRRGDSTMVWPHVEWMHGDPLVGQRTAATGVHIFRGDAIPALKNTVLFGDNPSGEVMFYDADRLPAGGSSGIRVVRFRGADGLRTKLLDLIKAKNAAQGKNPATRADLRFGAAADGRVFLMNKADGTIREITP